MMRLFSFFFLCACLLACQTAQKQAYDCKHCGMPSQEYPQWHAKAQIGDKTQWFCSPRCMFFRHGQASPQAVNAFWVKDYYTAAFINARTARFVIGSKILGPMGADLVAFQDEKSAKAFLQEHAGKQIISFGQITPALLRSLGE